MQLNPRYGPEPIIVLDGSPVEIATPAIRQRRRLAAALGSFTAEQWAHPSRCEGWSSRDVIVHLDSTNAFWTHSIGSGLRGEPTQLLATFDPAASPAELVAASADLSDDDVIERFVASTESLVDLLASLDDDDWSVRAEAPPGHLSVSAVVHHALWDSWVHERDILLPMGMAPDQEGDEVAASLRYSAALGPGLAIGLGVEGEGVLAVEVTGPDVAFVVEVGDRAVVREGMTNADLRLTGDAVELLEALSLRAPLDRPVPSGLSPMFAGLAEMFDAPSEGA